jgi:hypothetical protein
MPHSLTHAHATFPDPRSCRSPKCRTEYSAAAAPSKYLCFCGKETGICAVCFRSLKLQIRHLTRGSRPIPAAQSAAVRYSPHAATTARSYAIQVWCAGCEYSPLRPLPAVSPDGHHRLSLWRHQRLAAVLAAGAVVWPRLQPPAGVRLTSMHRPLPPGCDAALLPHLLIPDRALQRLRERVCSEMHLWPPFQGHRLQYKCAGRIGLFI